ncbi:MAG: DUF86 domain-containing protein [Phycisphaerae bacterium]|nr:DUF86 domain-containing protein [Phycisphaerae bacterium]
MSVDLASLVDIREAIRRATGFVEGLDHARFLEDERTRWAVFSQIVIIGEAANRVSRSFQERTPELPWREMISMRHRLVHGYDEVNWDRVWATLESDLPMLATAIAPFIPSEPE